MESIFPVECEIPSLKLAVELLPDTSPLEEHLVHLEQLDEQRRNALVALEVNKSRIRSSTISLSVQGGLVKETWSFCGINRNNPWGQGNLILCGVVLMWLSVC